ncbi:GATA transcription factor 29 [Linum grandiflorum]
MKNLNLNLKLSFPCNANDTNDVSNATPNNFDSESVQPTFDSNSPRAIITQGEMGSSGRVNKQYRYGAPTFGMVNHEDPNHIVPAIPWMIPGQQPTPNNNSIGTIVVGVPAATVYMNQMGMVNNEPVLQLAPPNISDDQVGESSSSNSNSTSVSLVPPTIHAAHPNFFNEMMFCQNQICLLCKTCETPMWRRGPLGAKTLCNACGIKFQKEEKKKKKRPSFASGSK